MQRTAAIAFPLLIVLGLAIWRSYGPEPTQPLPEIMNVTEPHPVGSPANAIVRDRVMNELRAAGYQPAIQRRFVCNARINCATVENIIARLPGSSPDTIVLASHYDSVRYGPGVSDDLMGTAALLEIARTVRKGGLRNTVVFLITDGEEAGLLGAEAFAADPSLMKDVAVVLNVENRGTYGASNMFETSRGNRWLIRHLADALPRPQATSLYQTVYDLLPNDTDVSVFKRDGKAVLNFAAIRGVHWYHTPMDDFAHASPRTLQHHRENLLWTLRVLANADLAARGSEDAVYFDVLGFFMVWWPARLTIWLAVISLVLLVIAVVVRKTNPRTITFGVLATFAAILFAFLGGAAVSWLARLRSGDANWVAYPIASIAAMWLTGIASAMLAAAMLRKRANVILGAAMVFHAAAIVLAFTVPGPSFLFLVPAVLVTIFALIRADETVIGTVAATGAAIVIFPMGVLLYDALGARLMYFIAVLIALVAIWIAPLIRGAATVFALAIVAAIAALILPAYSDARPKFDWPEYKPPKMQITRSGDVIRVRSLEGPKDLRIEVDRPVVSINDVRPAPPTRRRPRSVERVFVLNAEDVTIVLGR